MTSQLASAPVPKLALKLVVLDHSPDYRCRACKGAQPMLMETIVGGFVGAIGRELSAAAASAIRHRVEALHLPEKQPTITERRVVNSCACHRSQPDPNPGHFRASDRQPVAA